MSHMGRDALENGPHEPRMVPCWRCGGEGGRYDTRDAWWPCRVCDESGEITVEDLLDHEVDC